MGHGSTKAVYSAIAANSLVALAKFGAFSVTGSGAMLSEGIHSVADVGNQALLVVGIKRSQRPADEDHPYGYDREQFTWALISAVGIFFLGCGVTVMHGIHSLTDPHPPEGIAVSLGVLALSFVLEGASWAVAVWAVRNAAQAAGMTFKQYLRDGSDPMAVAVVMEDSAAVLGVTIAGVALTIAHFTQDGRWDGIASIAIGLLMGYLAVFLIRKNKDHLVGKAVDKRQRDAIRKILEGDEVVEHIEGMKAVVMGAESSRLAANIEFDGRKVASRVLEGMDLDEILAKTKSREELEHFLTEFGDMVTDQLGDEIDRVEQNIRDVVPGLTSINLEAE